MPDSNAPYILQDVPDDYVASIVSEFQDAGCSVTKTRQADGKWTVTATPPKTSTAAAAVKTETQVAAAIAKLESSGDLAGGKDAPWIAIARAEIGQHEVSGSTSNKRILAYHASVDEKISSDEVPWCSSFVNFCIESAGLEGTNSARARSWLKWGKPIDAPEPGCVVVLSRGAPPQGHVGFWIGATDTFVSILGGNQGDAVNISKFPASRILGYRMPAK